MDTLTIQNLVISAAAGLLGLTVPVMGWLIVRAIQGVDGKLAKLDTKVDALTTKDNAHSESIVELKVRVAHLESEFVQFQRSVQRRRVSDSETPG